MLVEGRLGVTEAAQAHRHIRDCPDCGLVLAGLGDAAQALPPESASSLGETTFAPGDRVGRFVLTRLVGAGGMGAVWSARDPELGRAVALKLVRPGMGSGGDARQNRRRLLHEAKVMANLAHPNVVPVFEVGEVGEQLFVVMELVEGETLAGWLQRPHPLAKILEVFLAAGNGLLAAHAADIVHRDFKPDNVLMGKDERPRVSDFGLARTPHSLREPAVQARPLAELDAVHPSQTPMGALLGTPAYMAPEQLDGAQASAASDLFAFCTALHEALYKSRPYSGKTLLELRASMHAGPPRLVSSPRLPSRLRSLLLRGLSDDPRARPSMSELLHALGSAPSVRRRRLLAAALGVIALGAIAAAWLTRPDAKRVCSETGQRFAGVWDGPRQREIESAFLATNLVYAGDAYQRVAAAFERFRTSWLSNYTTACELGAQKQPDDALAYLQMACLTQQLAAAQAKSDLFAKADQRLVEVAAAIAAALDEPESCTRTAGRSAPPPPEPWQRSAVEHVREQLARAHSLSEAGRFPDAQVLAKGAIVEADKTGWPPLKAEALLELARTMFEMDDPVNALDTATEAALGAEGARHDEVAAQAWLLAVQVTSLQLSRIQQSRELYRHAQAAVERLGGDALLTSHLENLAANLLQHEGKFTEAEQANQRAITLYETTGRKDQFYTWLLNDEAVSLNLLGRDEEAVQIFQRAVEMKELLLGARHPDLGVSLSNEGSTLTDLGRYDEAQRCLNRAAEIFHAALKPDHFWITGVDTNLGDLAYARRNYPLARTWYERAIALGEGSAKAGHPFTLEGEIGLARTLMAQGIPSEAMARLEQALNSGYSFETLDLAAAQFALARAQVAAGRDPAAARALARKARATCASTGQTGKRRLAEMDSWLAQNR